jgi:hypothetical protein|tara:strand:+ start:1389 stop:2288 length:900 start_codon:yes stop_codon:yes gene_type:complete
MSEIISKRIQTWLKRYNRGEVFFSEEVIAKVLKSTENRFAQRRSDKFRLRMSNLGKPICQLQNEKMGTKRNYVNEYQRMYTFMAGDTGEQWLLAVMAMAGVNIEAAAIKTELEIDGEIIKGEADVIIDGKVWDIKTMSHVGYMKYVNWGGFKDVESDDPFGYITQGFLYGTALDIPFGGWIIISKSTGDIAVAEVPVDYDTYRKKSWVEASWTVGTIRDTVSTDQIVKLSTEEEVFKKKKTGNTKLCKTCSYCDFKETCWPDRITAPQAFSEAKSPVMVEYTELNYITLKKEIIPYVAA